MLVTNMVGKEKENVGNEKNIQAIKLKVLSFYLIFFPF